MRCIVVQPDGRILIAGHFTTYNGASAVRFTRLMQDGSIDPSLTNVPFLNDRVHAMALGPDGKIHLAGEFYESNDLGLQRIFRLHTDGSRDFSFTHAAMGNSHHPKALLVDQYGSITVGGSMTVSFEPYSSGIVKFTASGDIDYAFQPGSGFDNVVNVLAQKANGSLLVGGTFDRFNGLHGRRLVQLDGNGGFDPSFNPQTGANATVECVRTMPGGALLLGGWFSSYNGIPSQGMAKLSANGQSTYLDDYGWMGGVTDLLVLPDGRFLCAGAGGWGSYAYLQRRFSSGTIDSTFSTGSGINSQVRALARQPDGKIIIAGWFTTVDGVPRNRVARLHPDGALDLSFVPGIGPNTNLEKVLLLPDGRVLLGGPFTLYNGMAAGGLVCLLPDGTMDPAFTVGGGSALGALANLALQPDGRILVARTMGVERLFPDGTVDGSFQPSVGGVKTMVVAPDGRILIGGAFLSVNGIPRGALARLFPDGSVDPGFQAASPPLPLGFNAYSVHNAVLLPDGKYIVVGTFGMVDGVGRNRIARVHGGNAAPPIRLSAKALLGGALPAVPGLMQDGLRTAALLPANEPYSGLDFPHMPGGGGMGAAPSVFNTTGNNAIVDWVVLELRAPGDPATVLATRSALIQRDGDVVDVDGVSSVPFFMPPGNYHVAIRHRNHLGCMTAAPIALSATPASINFTNPATPTWGTATRKNVDGTMVLWPGDATFDGVVKYVGAANDRDAILLTVGGNTPTNVVSNVYHNADHNMDGQVKYMGAANDRDIILQTIGGGVPTATRIEQLP